MAFSFLANIKENLTIGRIKNSAFWASIFILFSILPILLAIYQLFRIALFDVTLIDNSYLYYILMFYLPVVFLLYPLTQSSPRDRVPWYDGILFLMAAITCGYFGLHGLDIVSFGWEYDAPLVPSLLSLLLWILVLEAVRRASDLGLAITCFLFSLYPLCAHLLPGFLQGQSFDLLTTARLHAMGANSIVGLPISVLCTLLIGFILFGTMLQYTGGGAFFFNLASSLLGQSRGGAAKIGVLGSAFFGMLSGSTVSNVVAIGSMTIPAMKRTGFAPHYAAAIESCASAGGPITPPVMGAAAFVMASFLNVPYIDVCIAAAIPAYLYYLGLFVQVDGYAAKSGLKGLPKNELPPIWGTLKEGWYYLGVIVVMTYFLLTLAVEAWAPFYASAALLILSCFKRDTRLTWPSTIKILTDLTGTLVQLVAILAAAGLLIGGLSVTGVALSFSRELVAAVGDNSLLILLAGAVTSFILGLGMPTTACYIFLAVVMVPALTAVDIYPMGAHLFVFYWGALSDLTPPTALCVAAACGIAKSNFMQTGWTAMRLGFTKYIVPFFFVYNAALLFHGSIWDVLLVTSFASIGIIYLGCAFEGYLWGVGSLSLVSRIVLGIGGLLTAFPELITTLIGIGMLAVTHLICFVTARAKKAASSTEDEVGISGE
jgi:TRAP transporter 4TM/12TM fusion protein